MRIIISDVFFRRLQFGLFIFLLSNLLLHTTSDSTLFSIPPQYLGGFLNYTIRYIYVFLTVRSLTVRNKWECRLVLLFRFFGANPISVVHVQIIHVPSRHFLFFQASPLRGFRYIFFLAGDVSQAVQICTPS